MKNLLTAKEMKSVDENAQTLYHMPDFKIPWKKGRLLFKPEG